MTRPRLVIDPAVCFGRPCVEHTGTPAETIAGCVIAGDSIDLVAHYYGIPRAQVIVAVWWQVRQILDTPASRRRSADRRVADAWGDWWADTDRLLWHDQASQVPDPPEIEQ